MRKQGAKASRRTRGFTLIEMLVTVAALVILLGLAVALARNVRRQEAVALTKDLLRRLDAAMTDYAKRHDGRLPAVSAFPPPMRDWNLPAAAAIGGNPSATAVGPTPPAAVPHPAPPETLARAPASGPAAPWRGQRERLPDLPPPGLERLLTQAALANSRDLVAALRADAARPPAPGVDPPRSPLAELPLSMYDEITLRDAWGSPIVFMPAMHPWVGAAFYDRFYFFSAGADRQYLTLDDNLYSYDPVSGGL